MYPTTCRSSARHAPPIALGQRAFEIVLARQVAAGETETTWFERHGSTPITEVPVDWPADYRDLVRAADRAHRVRPRRGLDRASRAQAPLESGAVGGPQPRRAARAGARRARRSRALGRPASRGPRPSSPTRCAATPLLVEALELLAGDRDADLAATVRRLVLDAAVPHLAAQRLTEKGLRKRAVWERVWELQRAEDRGEAAASCWIPVTSLRRKYCDRPDFPCRQLRQGDCRSAWKHRGKLDVPKERFVLYPERRARRGHLAGGRLGRLGRARSRARARRPDHWSCASRTPPTPSGVTPLLAGVLELLPWIHQWHPDLDPLYGGPPGAFFEGWLDGQLAELGVTRETRLRAWRPPCADPRTEGRRRSTT